MKNIILENRGLKITAVILSIVLWMFVASRGQSEISLDVPVEFSEIPDGIEIVSQSTKVISLKVRGQEGLLKNIRPADVAVSIDLSKAKPGESTYYITREEILLPRSINVTNINPSSVRLLTEETSKKTVRVIPVITGDPEKGYSVKSVSVTPTRIEIEGIRREIARVSALKTDTLDVTDMNETFAQELKLDLASRNVRSKISTVNVHVVIEPRSIK